MKLVPAEDASVITVPERQVDCARPVARMASNVVLLADALILIVRYALNKLPDDCQLD